MSTPFGIWLFDTFVFTGLLIALVLVLRRPVARHFGPQFAYALWALPLLRFLLPPIVLPASMAPVVEQAPLETAQPVMITISEPMAEAGASDTAIASGADIAISLLDLALPLWLAGAAIFLFMRWRDYRAMRERLLAKARPVGEAGKVRLVETPAVSSPVAFGVRDKVVALPPEFMAHHDRAARDLAIAHELAHHRGHDLLANIAAQPILALHWFNPLAWWGWRAMRADQEAACDARVIAGKGRQERATYAQVIAGFAAGDDLVLAAPMACPVLGEKSIIHRLRSLTMSDISTRRRRLGIAAITTTALALPLTASISYAHAQQPELPLVPDVPDAPDAPEAPLPLDAPDAPVPPAPPAPPEAPAFDEAQGERLFVYLDDAGRRDRHVQMRRFDREFEASLEGLDEDHIAEIRAEVEAEMREVERDLVEQREERAQAMAETSRARAEAGQVRARAQQARAGAQLAANSARQRARAVAAGAPRGGVQGACGGEDGMIACQTTATAAALDGIRAARMALSQESGLPMGVLEEVLRSLDEQIELLEDQLHEIAYRPASGPSAREAARFEVRVVTTQPGAAPVMQVQRVVYSFAPHEISRPRAAFAGHGLTT